MSLRPPRELIHPFAESAVRALRAGDRVRLSGLLYTGRDRLHKHLAGGGACPVVLRDGGLYHCGPVALPDGDGGWRILAAGPTTSMREEPYMAQIIACHGVRVVIGKGGMGDATCQACREHGCIYVQAVGGAAALLAERVRTVNGVWFDCEFGPTEALWALVVEGFEGIVGIDARGVSLYDRVRRRSRERRDALIEGGAFPRPGRV